MPTSSIFVTGDIRGNENLELTALQTLFVRNHNRLARELQQEHPDWNDEQLYQEARKLNIAQEQIIRSDFMAISAASRIFSRDRPLPSTMRSQLSARMSAANASKPSV